MRALVSYFAVCLAVVALWPAAALAGPQLSPDIDLDTGIVTIANTGDAAAGPSVAVVACEPQRRRVACPPFPGPDLKPVLPDPNNIIAVLLAEWCPPQEQAFAFNVPPLQPGERVAIPLPFWNALDFFQGSYGITVLADANQTVEVRDRDRTQRTRVKRVY